ncbi:MAG: DUF1446 domain-containing protein [Candidatus Dormibacteraeota bacterium]|nr:DUF1446 domain-containing protein [Candidatus Dormibacteraeota bacterium]
MREPLRIANCSGFYGDRFSAAREMVEGGPIDILTGEYLAELTMLILWKARQRDPSAGYAATFLRQMEQVLGTALERGIRVVTNAGGLNPAGLAERLRELAGRLGLSPRIVHLEGDDLMPRLAELRAAGHHLRHLETGTTLEEAGVQPLTANAYLGGWGIAQALAQGADIVVCPRVTDASLVLGPAAWRFGWAADDWDRVAGAVVAGHVIECGAQATGGNYSFFREVRGLEHPGFPIAEVFEDGSSVITKHPGTGGQVSVGTVTAQLLYEIEGPRYVNPDVVARFDSIRLSQEGPDRVRISGVRGEPAPPETKVSLNYAGGYRNSMSFVLTGLDVEAKADLARRTLFEGLGGEGAFEAVDVRLLRLTGGEAQLRVTVKDPDPRKVGRAFSARVIEMALASYPGFHTTTPPTPETAYGVHWPALVPAQLVDQVVVAEDGSRHPVGRPPTRSVPADRPEPGEAEGLERFGPTEPAPLGVLFGARSGDKGGNANCGVWARSPQAFEWLDGFLTAERFRELIADGAEPPPGEVRRYRLPNLLALNFVVVGLLGEGVASSTRPDPQAKGLGEVLRSRSAPLPRRLLAG